MSNEYVQDYSAQEKLIRSRLEDSRISGVEEGERNKQLEIAKKLLEANITLEIISSSTGLTIEELAKLKEE